MKYWTFDFYVSFSDVIASTKKEKIVMAVIERLNVNIFTSEQDNDAFFVELA